MKKYLSFLICALILSTGCSQQDDLQYEPQEAQNSKTDNPFRISKEEALQNAEEFFSGFGNAATRSTRTVASIDVIGSDGILTRSGESQDTLLYVVNYEDEQGFVIMGADKRSLPLYAISDTGNFEIDEETPETVKMMLGNIQQHAALSTSPPVLNPNVPWFNFKGWDQDIQYKIGPLLSDHQSKLYGGMPYSKYCFLDGKHVDSGCVMVAAEQMLSYYNQPIELEGQYFNWSSMNLGLDDDGIARMIEILGRQEYLKAHYEVDKIATSYRSYIIPAMKSLGFTTPNEFINFYENIDAMIDALHIGPIYMQASKYFEELKRRVGHVWIVDGMIRYKVEIPYTGAIIIGQPIPESTYRYYNVFHCVWGNKGKCNGYYFSEFQGVPDFYDQRDPGYTDGAEVNCVYDSEFMAAGGFVYNFK